MIRHLKILQVSFDYLPQSIGGTEIYVAGLVKNLKAIGHEVRVGITSSESAHSYCYDETSIDVIGFQPNCAINKNLSRSSKSDLGLRIAAKYLKKMQPDIVHFHPLTLSPMLPLMEAVHKMGIPSICTYHTPTVTCGRGDMLRWGNLPCDGRMDWQRCTSCVLNQKGAPRPLSRLIVKIPYSFFRSLTRSKGHLMPRKVYSMFSIPVQRMSHIQEWKRAVRCIDSWVAVSGWVKDVLIINGLPLENIVSSRQGLCFSSRHGAEGKESNQERMAKRFSTVVSHSAKGPFNLNNSLHLGYLGRIHPYKGIHVMIQAMQLLKDCENIKLDIAGCDDSKENKYQKDLMNTTRNATRIRWHSKLMPDQIGDFMKTIDVLVIPSVWLETGPMTILEAWAQGVPVLGSNLGGIAEWVEEYGGGWLFKSGNAVELKQSILRLVNNPNMISSIQIPEHVRTIEDVAHEMQEVYDELISRKKRVVALC